MVSEQPESIETTEEGDGRGFQDDLNALANDRGRPVLLINCLMVDELITAIEDISVANPAFRKHKQLSVLLKSRGGSATATYKLILALRNCADDIEVLVPDYAKSAATFFCLGSDMIYMGQAGELGPLDPQVIDRTGGVRPLSALETFKGLEHLLNHSIQAYDAIFEMLLVIARLDVPIAIEKAEPLFAAIASPLYKNVDLRELREFGRYLAEIEQYSLRVMFRWGYKNHIDTDPSKISHIVHRLVWEYPSHEFVIDLAEAQAIGLNAKLLDSSSEEISKRILDSGIPVGLGLPDEAVDLDNPSGKELYKEAEEDDDEAQGQDTDENGHNGVQALDRSQQVSSRGSGCDG